MAVVKKGLGKGLDSLIVNKFEEQPDKREFVVKENNVSRETLININLIEPNRSQPRNKFDEDTLQELADSIKTYGMIQPLIVQKRDKMYEIIAGERRWRASRIAGLKDIPVIIKDYSPEKVFEIALIENIQREDLNPVEEALAYQRLIQEYGLRQDEVAEKVSKSRVSITNALRLLKLDKRIQEMLIDDMISEGHARALLAIKDYDLQYNAANQVFDQKLSVRETEKLVKHILKPDDKGKNKVSSTESAVYRDYEDKLKFALGSKVEIRRNDENKGKILIDFYSAEEFERIYDFIANKA